MAKRKIPELRGPFQLWDFLSADHRFPAVYFLYDEGELVYVGQSTTLKWRIETHLQEGVKTFDAVGFVPCCVSRLLAIEGEYIREFAPRYNRCGIATTARREGDFVSDDPPIRVVDGEDVVGSLGLARIMGCDRAMAKELLTAVGKDHVALGDAFYLAVAVNRSRKRTA